MGNSVSISIDFLDFFLIDKMKYVWMSVNMLVYWMYVIRLNAPQRCACKKEEEKKKLFWLWSPYFLIFQAVFHVEYVDQHSQGSSKRQSVCNDSRRPSGFTTLIKDWDLTAWRLTCPLSSSASAGFPRLISVLLLAVLSFVNQAIL